MWFIEICEMWRVLANILLVSGCRGRVLRSETVVLNKPKQARKQARVESLLRILTHCCHVSLHEFYQPPAVSRGRSQLQWVGRQ